MPLSLREAPDVASPRTAWSTHNRKELATWTSCHATLVEAANAYVPSSASASLGRRLVLFGDSITESWRGTSYGRAVPRTKGVLATLNATLGQRWAAPIALGIAADCTQHLLWRMTHGEITPAMAQDPSLAAVLLIGTNNMGKGHSVDETVAGIVACATHLLNGTRGRLLINAVLPRGDRRKKGRRKGRSYLADVASVNAALSRTVAATLARAYPARVRYVDCGAPFYASDALRRSAFTAVSGPGRDLGVTPFGGERVDLVRRELMPDRLHPNAAGHLLWGRCLVAALADAEAHEWGR